MAVVAVARRLYLHKVWKRLFSSLQTPFSFYVSQIKRMPLLLRIVATKSDTPALAIQDRLRRLSPLCDEDICEPEGRTHKYASNFDLRRHMSPCPSNRDKHQGGDRYYQHQNAQKRDRVAS